LRVLRGTSDQEWAETHQHHHAASAKHKKHHP
jgi:hypothetical protein